MYEIYNSFRIVLLELEYSEEMSQVNLSFVNAQTQSV